MSKEMVISANPHETRVAILEEGQLCEYYVEREKEFALVGSIYKGKVTRVLPGMQSAFVEIGLDSDAFLYVSDFLEEIEGLDHVETAVEDKAAKPGDAAGAAPAASTSSAIENSDAEVANGILHEHQGAVDEQGNFASPAVAAPAPSFVRPAPPANRGGYQNRPPQGGGDRGGRNRFGGRGGRNRPGGRGGSGGRSGDRRFGRELPSSKYASSRGPEDQSVEASAPEGHISIVLPGESLAKFREKPASSEPAAFGHDAETQHVSESSAHGVSEPSAHDFSAPPQDSDKESKLLSSFGSFDAPTETPSAPPPSRAGFAPRSASRPSFSGGIEPLPGESLSKWKTHQHLPPEPATDNSPVPEAVQFASLSPLMPPGADVDSAHVPEKSKIDESRIFSEPESASERTETAGE